MLAMLSHLPWTRCRPLELPVAMEVFAARTVQFVATSPMWLLDTWNVASATEGMNSSLYSSLINLN